MKNKYLKKLIIKFNTKTFIETNINILNFKKLEKIDLGKKFKKKISRYENIYFLTVIFTVLLSLL